MASNRLSFESDIGELWREAGEGWKTFGYTDKRNGKTYWVRACRVSSPVPVVDALMGKPYVDTGALQFETDSKNEDTLRHYRGFRSPVDNQPIIILETVGLDLIGENDRLIETVLLNHLVEVTGPKVLDRASRQDYNSLLAQYQTHRERNSESDHGA
jgi:hypothetical protein